MGRWSGPKSAIAISAVALFVSGGLSGLLGGGFVDPTIAAGPAPPEHPRLIVAIGLHQAELALALAPDRVLALDVFADDPEASFVVEEARAVPARVTASTESILGANPDLVLLPGWVSLELERAIAGAGVAVHREPMPTSLAQIRESIVRMSALLDADPEVSSATLASFDRALAEVRALPPITPRPSVLLLAATGTSAGQGTLFAELVEVAGGRIALGSTGIVSIPLETVLRLDPTFIVLDGYRADGTSRAVGEDGIVPEGLRSHLGAFREGRVHALEARLANTTSHHVAETLSALAELFRSTDAPRD